MSSGGVHGGSRVTRLQLRWTVAFFVLFIRFMLVPASPFGMFVNLFVIVNLLLIPPGSSEQQERFVMGRLITMMSIFLSFELNDSGNAKKE